MRLFAASLLLSALATPALAQNSDKPFDGASATAITGVDFTSEPGNNNTGVVYGGQLDYDIQRGKTVFGVEGELTGSTSKGCGGSAIFSYCTKQDRDLYVGGKIGRVVGDSTLLYAKVGYTNNRLTGSYVDNTTTPATSGRGASTLDGVRGGVGVEQKLGKAVSLKAEYRYLNYEGSYSRNQGVVGLGFHF